MPFKSQAQRRFMYSQEPEIAKRWEKETPKGKKLPEKVAVIEKTAFWSSFFKQAEDSGYGDGGSGFTGTGKGALGTSNEGRPTAQGNVGTMDDTMATKEFRDRERGPKSYGIFDMGEDYPDDNIPHIMK